MKNQQLPFAWVTLVAIIFAASIVFAQTSPDWTEPFPPFRIVGNLYYVGSKGLANYLITTPQGHILINSDLEANVSLLQASVEKLGFKFTDIKILLISHAHWDHDAGSAQIKRLTGATYMVMDADVPVVESGGKDDFQYGDAPACRYPPVKVDRVLHDGDEVKLGDATLVAHLTPGHTKGCTTWTMKIVDEGKTYDVVIIGSPNVNAGYKLVNNPKYPAIASDYARMFRVLKSLPCDYFLGAHGDYFAMEAKFAKLKPGAPSPFIDPDGYKKYVALKEADFQAALAAQQAGSATPPALRHVTVNGADFAYVEAGAGTPVVLVHGALGDCRDWTPQVAALASRFHVIAYSRRYHYPNERIAEGADYTLAQHADDLVAFLQALHLPPVNLVGHSYGGSAAAIAAAAHPELVRTLTLVEPSLFSLIGSNEEGRALLARQNQAYGQVIARLDRGEGDGVLRDFIDLVAGPGAYEHAPAAAQAEMKENLSTLKPMLRGKNRGAPFTPADAAKLKMPVLLIGSERSPRIFHLTEDKLESILPNARRITLKGVSHFSVREAPAAFNAALLQFLSHASP